MTDLDDFKKTDLVDDVLAAHVNKLQAASMQSGFGNFETLTATRELVDNDTAYQVFTLAAAAQDVELPALNTAANHIFLIMNDASSSYAATVKTFSGAATVATLAAGEASLFVADDGTWAQIGGGGDVEGTAVLSTGETGGTKFLREDGDDSCSWQTVSSGGLTPTADSADSNVAYSAGNEYNVTMGGFSANRNRTIPVASAAGEEIRINILDGDADYALIILGVATITINGGSAATEWSRLFIGGETVTLRSTSTTNWQVVNDGRITQKCQIVPTGTQAIATATLTQVDFAAESYDIGYIGDVANNRIKVRRDGKYVIVYGVIVDLTAAATIFTMYIRDTTVYKVIDERSTAGNGRAVISAALELSDTDYIDVAVFHNSGNTDDVQIVGTQLTVNEIF
jgi:hypothetical protein